MSELEPITFESLVDALFNGAEVFERRGEIYADYAHDTAKSPLNWVDKQQALLDYILAQQED